jgi:hypothetical protein
MRPPARSAILFSALLSLPPLTTRAGERDERIESLERRVAELEARLEAALDALPAVSAAGDEEGEGEEDPAPQGAAAFADLYEGLEGLPDWIARVRLGGSANVGYFDGERDSLLEPASFAVWDARFFVDASLGEEVLLADRLMLRDAGFSFEWNLVRLGELENDVGDLFVDLRGIGGSSWLNAQVGRFQIPVGESYLNYGKGYAKKAFVTNDLGPWFWDEGIRLYGSDFEGRYGYVASVSDGDNSFQNEADSDKQVTLKLFARPRSWLQLSVSGARTGRLGSSGSPTGSALWLGESWARGFGASSAVPNFIDGAAVPDGPDILRSAYLVGADAIVERSSWGRLWLGYGSFWMDSRQDGGFYDVRLQYWIAELVLEGRRLAPALEPFYLGVRATGLGSYDSGQGYLLDVRYDDTLGYNMESLHAYSLVLGWRMTEWLRLRLEYSHVDVDLVRGLPDSIRNSGGPTDGGAIELGVHF